MSLLRLLTAGKSLIGLKDTSEYRVSRHRLLPKFASKKNPFRATTRPEPGRGAAITAPEEAVADGGRRNDPSTIQGELRTAGSPAPTVAPAPRAEVRSAGSRIRGRFKLADWLFNRDSKPQRATMAKLGKPLVQAELGLERVKVVRNDLSDSDLEVVPAPVSAVMAEGSSRKASANQVGTTALGQMTSGVIGAGGI